MPNFDSVYSLAARWNFTLLNGSLAAGPSGITRHASLDGVQQLGLAVLTPADLADRAGIVAIRARISDDVKRHLIGWNLHPRRRWPCPRRSTGTPRSTRLHVTSAIKELLC